MIRRTVFAATVVAALVGVIKLCVTVAGTLWSLPVAILAVAIAFGADRFDQRRSLRYLDRQQTVDRIRDYTRRAA